jgi:quinol-cytochrome oxidoreductase complex cytochrome b subunit
MKRHRIFLAIIAAFSLLAALVALLAGRHSWLPVESGTNATPSPVPLPTATPGLLDRPLVSDPPTQVEEGHLIFWGVCMACHGDRGQGLTDEWRELAFKEDKDCWTSKCHAANHPPQGFEFPKTVPALAGGGRLGRFASAQQLYDYVVAMMPWWNPGSLTPDKGWQVTAFLLQLNGTLPAGIMLDGTVASAVPVHRQLLVPESDTTLALIFAATLALAMVAIVLREALRRPLAPLPAGATPSSSGNRSARRPSFVSHLHPPTIPALQARWRYSLGAGGFGVFLCLVLLATGLLEMFYYIPTPEQAAVSVETIHFFVPLGALVRNLHYWSAQLLVVVAAVHLLRVVFTAAYTAPRRFNFLLGMGLFIFVLLLDFTGYVLRWDEGIRWALTAGTNLLNSIPLAGPGLYKFVVGGSQTGPSTLVRFYAWHIFALTIGAAAILIWHVFRVRRDGGISAPPASRSAGSENPADARILRSELVRREVLGMFIGGILLLLLSTFVPAPLAAPIQGIPTLSTDTRAPWFFLCVQQLLKLGDPFLLGVLTPVLTLVLISLIPYILPGSAKDELGRWFPRSARAAQILLAVLALIILGLTFLALLPSSNA